MPFTWGSTDCPVPVEIVVCHCYWTLITIQDPVIPLNIFVKPNWFGSETQDLGIQVANPSLQELNKPQLSSDMENPANQTISLVYSKTKSFPDTEPAQAAESGYC